MYRLLTYFLVITFSLTTNAFAESVATPADRIQVLNGFQVDRLYSVPANDQGSWVALTVDPEGRLITADQYGKLYRVTLPTEDTTIQIDSIDVDIRNAHGVLYAFDSLYVMVNGDGSGLYRLFDTNGDDTFDRVEKLFDLQGVGEHGPHSIVPSTDGKRIYFNAGNHTDLVKYDASRVPPVWKEDHLLGRMWDARGHAAGKLAPGGWICRCDPNGENIELVSTGYRNEFDIALNTDGELFTFDADMEWDIGTPWYRPTRINHATSGSEFGWRSGTGKWPAYYADCLPAAVDIGPGSPTGIVFGSGAKFPAKYQRALFVCDWSYGKLYAVHLEPHGASYKATFEQFVAASPLPLTDLVIHPDGNMYFAIGGRRTQSGLYRVRYVGNEGTDRAGVIADPGAVARSVRRRLEAFHKIDANAIETAWPFLGHADRFIRFAARVAVEHQPVGEWKEKALQEVDPQRAIYALVALARNADARLAPQAIAALNRIDAGALSTNHQLALLRAYALTFVRLGAPSPSDREAVVTKFGDMYPAANRLLNAELCQLLTYVEAPQAIDTTLDLIDQATTQEERIHYLFCLRELRGDWNAKQRKRYFEAFKLTAGDNGGASFGGFLKNIRDEAKTRLTVSQKAELGDALAALENQEDPTPEAARPFVKDYTLDELIAAADKEGLKNRDFHNGKRMFAAASCFKCHRLRGAGGISGPDLTAAGGRFSTQNLIESIVEPSREVSDQYQLTRFFLTDGRELNGRIVNMNKDNVSINTVMLDPNQADRIKASEIEETMPSNTSAMPTGLLNTMTLDEILDLLAYLRSGGDPEAGYFAASRH